MQWLHLCAYKGPSYLCISCYIYCHLADSPINPQHGGEGRTERNNCCFYTQASKQQLACISRHIGPMFLPRWSTPGVYGPPKSRDKQPHQFHITVSFVQKCGLSPLFLSSLIMCNTFSVSVFALKWNLFFHILPLLEIILYFISFSGVILCIKPFCPLWALGIIERTEHLFNNYIEGIKILFTITLPSCL